MLNKIPLLIIVLMIIFLITSLLSYITMQKVVTPERVGGEKPQSATAGGIVKISIVHPEKEAINSGANIK